MGEASILAMTSFYDAQAPRAAFFRALKPLWTGQKLIEFQNLLTLAVTQHSFNDNLRCLRNTTISFHWTKKNRVTVSPKAFVPSCRVLSGGLVLGHWLCRHRRRRGVPFWGSGFGGIAFRWRQGWYIFFPIPRWERLSQTTKIFLERLETTQPEKLV